MLTFEEAKTLTQFEQVVMEFLDAQLVYFSLEDSDNPKWYLVVQFHTNPELSTEVYISYMSEYINAQKYPRLPVDFILTVDDLSQFLDKFHGTYLPDEN